MTDDVETLAELLSWTSGEFTRWSETAHPDHNRWSWRGNGRGRRRGCGHDWRMYVFFREQAKALLENGVRLEER